MLFDGFYSLVKSQKKFFFVPYLNETVDSSVFSVSFNFIILRVSVKKSLDTSKDRQTDYRVIL